MIATNIGTNELNHLTFAGMDTVDLAKEYGTPVYLMDEARIRENVRTYRKALSEAFSGRADIFYAGKACAFTELYRILTEEGAGIDVVSRGELFTARKAGYPVNKACFHGNNKTDEDLRCAVSSGVGYICVDSMDELLALEKICAEMSERQAILIRVTPGIDPHTYEAVSTGKVDSKFGNAIATGQAEEIIRKALTMRHLNLKGIHCHVGSQVFAEDVFERAADVMLRFMADMREKTGRTLEVLDLGGGYGVRYTEDDPVLSIPEKIREVAAAVKAACDELDFPVPYIYLEPGRSIVADAGMTLYTVGSVKRIPGYRSYVSVDGGMSDNPRYALYRSRYTVFSAGEVEARETERFSVVGRLCESGDILQENVPLPCDIRRGDTLAVCTTGAYNYAMASLYNRLPRPPIVMLRDGTSRVVVRRETLANVADLDV
ncbi:MAG: diaminopimelate decarboxylase [Lachnospiraceae bacterium]|nr:diaminopimelate decarboxylase [Lachnospiraceae bacterium]